jgi:hypothetical protein
MFVMNPVSSANRTVSGKVPKRGLDLVHGRDAVSISGADPSGRDATLYVRPGGRTLRS